MLGQNRQDSSRVLRSVVVLVDEPQRVDLVSRAVVAIEEVV